jgi:hypothetical protein
MGDLLELTKPVISIALHLVAYIGGLRKIISEFLKISEGEVEGASDY